uniref:Reverse transcriptase domain-containing protein n=1 Tax=Tanacetum cinerariifolium TaxID=118510 RepID=A0A699JG35_TANCI|nr:hypothetical protein [Tanacetum cinerariifolium]
MVLMEFAIIKYRSLYNIRIGRTRMRSLGAVGSTIHSMIKFPNNQGVVTMETSREALQECKHLERVQGSLKEVQWRQREEKMSKIREQAERMRKKHSPSAMNFQTTMGTMLTTNCKQLLADVLRENRERMMKNKPAFIRRKEYIVSPICQKRKKLCTTLQRMMEKVLANQRGRNVGTYLKEILIKSKSKMGLVQDIKETLKKLKRVNIKIDPTMFSFKVKEGRFLGHMVTEKGLRADPGRIHAIILSPTLRSPNQIRSLFQQLTAISKFIPKLAELKHPIREARTRIEKAKESGWTNEAEEDLQRIKRKLSKL